MAATAVRTRTLAAAVNALVRVREARPVGPEGGLPAKPWPFDALAGCGALRSSVSDLMRFMSIELEGAPECVSEELRAALALAATERWRAPKGNLAMGLGWHLNPESHMRWHNGGTAGFHSYLALSPEQHTGVVVLANSSTAAVDLLGERLLALACGAKEAPPLGLRKALPLPPEAMQRLVGTYALEGVGDLVVTLESVGLCARLAEQPMFRVYAASESTFFYRIVEAELHFVLTDEGPASSVALHQNGRVMPGARK